MSDDESARLQSAATQMEQFEAAAQALGTTVEETGLSEEAIMAKVEQARQALHEQGDDPKSSL